jgi:PPM family protein phosphatase
MSNLVMTGRSDTGMVREHNEDCFLIMPENGFALLADGMGGHLAGEVASAMAVDQVAQHLMNSLQPGTSRGSHAETLPDSTLLTDAIKAANRAIHDSSAHRPEQAGMGTTIVAVTFRDRRLTVAHVGDSRLYRFRNGQLSQVTEDHSMVQELLRRGLITPEEARTSANKNLVTRALGVDPIVEVDVREQPIENGDLYLLCSDGLNDVLTDDEIAATVGATNDLETITRNLVNEVNARGGPDNVSIVLVRTGQT